MFPPAFGRKPERLDLFILFASINCRHMKKLFNYFVITLLVSGAITETRAQAGASLFPQAPGVQTYTYRNSMKVDVAATLDTIKSLGVTEVESSTNPNGLTPEAFRKLLDERQMKCPSVGADYAELVKDPSEIARKAKIVGASYVMVSWIPHENEF